MVISLFPDTRMSLYLFILFIKFSLNSILYCFLSQVMDAYRRIQAARAKKKTPTKKEKDLAMKALKERESVIKALETMGY